MVERYACCIITLLTISIEVRLAMDALKPLIADKGKQVLDARHKFARMRYARKYRWDPSPEVKAAIREAIFGRTESVSN